MKDEPCVAYMRRISLSTARQSLVRVSLDIGRVLADRDGVTFIARGTCMYPTVRPGDVLTIKPRLAADIAVGDIAVCRTSGYLFSHRVIDTGEHEGRVYIVTRPDNSRRGSDGPTFDENLLGVVVAIKRNGMRAPLVPTADSPLIRYYYKKRLAFIKAKELLKTRSAFSLSRSNPGVFYRLIARTWFVLSRPRLTYVVQVPLNATLGDAAFCRLEPDTFDPEKEWNGRTIGRWTIAAYRNGGREPAAWVAYERGEDGAWRVADAYVRLRYRGAGLDCMLMSQAEKIVIRNNR